ncbi:MAG: tetratricopeptide repeat protein [Bacteroidales bacterium]|nr:tetratricopeptide repeat protein [Bacteroidales bacterium]
MATKFLENKISNNSIFYLCILSTATFLLFTNALNGSFLNWDDTVYILNNELIKAPISLSSFQALKAFEYSISLPLFTFLIQYHILGADPFSYHLVNVIIHTINVILIFYLSRFFLKQNNLAFIIALLFAIHPMRSETVGWIIQRKDLMYSFFFLLSMISHINFLKSKNIFYLLLLLISAYLAQLCKIQSYTLPFIVLLVEFFIRKKIDNKSFILFFIVLCTQHYFHFFANREFFSYFFIYIFTIIIPSIYILKKDEIHKGMDGIVVPSIWKDKIKLNAVNLYLLFIFYFYALFIQGFEINFILFQLFIFLIIPFYINFLRKKKLDVSSKLENKLVVAFLSFNLLLLTVLGGSAFSSIQDLFNSLFFIISTYVLYLKLTGNLYLEIGIIKLLKRIQFDVLILTLTIGFIIRIQLNNNNDFNIFIWQIILFLTPFLLLKGSTSFNFFTNQKKVLIQLTGIFIVSFAFYFLFKRGISFYTDKDADLLSFTTNRVYLAFYSLSYYLSRLFYPLHLNAMHPLPEDIYETLPFIFRISALFLLLLTSIILTILYFVKDKTIRGQMIFGLLFFLINIGMVLHIVPILGRVVVADRYTYLAYFGLFFTWVVFFHYIYTRVSKSRIKKIFRVLAIVIFILLSYQTYTRNKVWENDMTFWNDAIDKNPNNHYAYFSIGLAYYENENYNKAISVYTKAIELYKEDSKYFSNRGATYVKLKEYEKAIDDLTKAIFLNTEDSYAFNNRGSAYFETGFFDKAIEDFKYALTLNPKYPEAYNNFQIAQKAQSLFEEVSDSTIVEFNPEKSAFFNEQGLKKAINGYFESAITRFNYALMYDSTNINALSNRANCYASINDFESAKSDIEKAITLNPEDGGLYLNLANIKHQLRNPEACSDWEKAVSMGVQQAQYMLDMHCRR